MLSLKNKLLVGMIILFSGVALPLEAQVKPDNSTVISIETQELDPAHRGSAKINYVRTWLPGKPITSSGDVVTQSIADVKLTTSYIDGQGRVAQTVSKQISPNGKDLVSYKQFDEYGRETKQPLAYASTATNGDFKINPYLEQQYYYTTPSQNNYQYANEKIYFGRFMPEPAPLGRMDWVTGAGNSMTGSYYQYLLNTTSDAVRIWTMADAAGSNPATSTTYGEGQLNKLVTTDANGNKIVEYKDKQGQLVLKKVQIDASPGVAHSGWLCTYYIYDDYGLLRCVVQPRGVQALDDAGWPDPLYSSVWATVLPEQCFFYEYDYRNRVILKKVPGSGEVRMVYDARDRLIMTQDQNQLAAGRWMYSQFDALNRPVTTGLWTNSSNHAYHISQAAASTSYPNPGSGYEVLTVSYYDDYNWVSGSGSGLSSTFISTYASNTSYFHSPSTSTAPYAQSITPFYAVAGIPTGNKVKLLGTSDYLYSVIFYDERGRAIQTQGTNISGAIDTVTMQYSFDSKLLRTLLCHAKGGTNSQKYKVLTKNEYDAGDRLSKISKKVGNSPETVIAENSYDELGQLKQKRIGLKRNVSSQNSYTSDVLDSISYKYNIRGWLSGINQHYAKADHNNNWFGMELCYDFGFSAVQFNGNIAGIKWRSRGDDEQRAFGYSYDAANRFLQSDFTQYANTAWTTPAALNFQTRSVSYDANGNILSMTQKGWKLGGSSIIDSLIYGYNTNSNKLKYVTDRANDVNSKLGDFKEITNNTSDDYTYDGNGNLLTDNNKDILVISYNHLNLPSEISVKYDVNSPYSSRTIGYTYDATGNKLKKTVTEVQGLGVNRIISTLYINGFVYDTKVTNTGGSPEPDDHTDVLQFISHEEGRVRPKTAGNTDTMYYDFFEKDHLGNVRIMLTDELKTDMYPAATMETANATVEETFYSNLSSTRVNVPSGYPDNTPSGNAKVAKVSGASGAQKLGPAILLKVMSGDKFNLTVNSWWNSALTPGTPVDPLNDLLSAIGTSAATVITSGHPSASQIINSTELAGGVGDFLTAQTHSSSTLPQAFVNWVLLDERFNFVSSSSGFQQVAGSGLGCPGCPVGDYETLSRTDMPITKSGYLYIYVSNTTPNINVYFDNLQVTHVRGPLLEENHYYPYGLTIAGLGSKAFGFGSPGNKFKYNGKKEQKTEFSDGSGLDWMDYGARMYDGQIGRFFSQDRLSFQFDCMTPYQYAANNPINYVDVNGDYIFIMGSESVTDAAGNTKKVELSVMYENGKAYHYSKGENGNFIKGAEYKGDNSFINGAVNDLNGIKNYSSGSVLVNDLQNSNKSLEIGETKRGAAGTAYFPGTNLIRYDRRSFNVDGLSTNSVISLGHEIAHAWSRLIGVSNHYDGRTGKVANGEIFAVRFENYLRAMSGETKMRMAYNGDGLGHVFGEGGSEYFKKFELPYRAAELMTNRVDANREVPGRARMDQTYHRINIHVTTDSREKKITVTSTN